MMKLISPPIIFVLIGYMCSAVAVDGDNPEKSVDAYKPTPESHVYIRRSMMMGKWLGESPTKEGGVRRWLVERFEDGTYRIQFQTMRAHITVEEHIEVGHWGISGPVYFGIYRGKIIEGSLVKTDPSDAYNYDAYEILELTENRFRYRHYETSNEYVLKKVPNDYKLPKAEGA